MVLFFCFTSSVSGTGSTDVNAHPPTCKSSIRCLKLSLPIALKDLSSWIANYLCSTLHQWTYIFFLGGYRIVYTKVPEFIVPDLTGFEVIQLYLTRGISRANFITRGEEMLKTGEEDIGQICRLYLNVKTSG